MKLLVKYSHEWVETPSKKHLLSASNMTLHKTEQETEVKFKINKPFFSYRQMNQVNYIPTVVLFQRNVRFNGSFWPFHRMFSFSHFYLNGVILNFFANSKTSISYAIVLPRVPRFTTHLRIHDVNEVFT